jgi:FkbM family methyltransferase
VRALITDLIESALRAPAPFPEMLVVYGAGNKGRQVCADLQARGVRIAAVLDVRASAGQQCAGIAVSTPEAWCAVPGATELPVLIAIHNEHTPIPPIQARLAGLGVRRVLTLMDMHDAFDDLAIHYWLGPRRFYVPYSAELARLADLLADATSRHWLESVLRFRLGGDYSALPAPGLADQYLPSDLPRWPETLRFIDCGAFTGDTVLALVSAGYRFEAVAAFEPDLDNFAQLVRNTAHLANVVRFPCGVAERACRIGFVEGQGGASHLDEEAVERITCVALDESLPDFRSNLIKMDIEGAELLALSGAAQSIATARPALAISLYHHPEHLWRIPFLIDDWALGYRFYLRGHGESSFDLVLYALPD